MMQHVPGENRGKINLYALSTCGWCEKTKNFLDELGVAYSYVYVDLLDGEEQESVINEVRRWNPHCSFPTVVTNEQICIVGFDKQKIKEAIRL
ncbi:MAG: glutaredoxin family protein [bacterium]